jgi:hypothetical protein
MKPLFARILCSVSLLVTFGAFASEEKSVARSQEVSFCYTTCPVRLHGLVKYEMSYGPPGYGDTPQQDVKIQVPLLVLQKPISVNASDVFLSAADQTEIQIETSKDLRAMSGRCVEVSGTLRGGVTATDITPVVLILETIVDRTN